MGLQLATLHALLALAAKRAQHGEFVQQVAHQEARRTAMLQLKPLAVHGAEVLIVQEVAEALEAVRVAARRVHRLQKRLEANVTHQLIIHLILVFVQVTVLAFVALSTFLAHPRPRQATRHAARLQRHLSLRHGSGTTLDLRWAKDASFSASEVQPHQAEYFQSRQTKHGKLLHRNTPRFCWKREQRKAESHVRQSFFGSCRPDRK